MIKIINCRLSSFIRNVYLMFIMRNRLLIKIMSCILVWLYSVPARLGKGQGAKEIGHNLARERPKFGHNLVRKRHKIEHSLERE